MSCITFTTTFYLVYNVLILVPIVSNNLYNNRLTLINEKSKLKLHDNIVL